MNICKFNAIKSIKSGTIAWNTVDSIEEPESKSRMVLKYLSIIFLREYCKQLYKNKEFSNIRLQCCHKKTCSETFGHMNRYEVDVYSEEEAQRWGELFEPGVGFYRGKQCILPLHLLSDACRHRSGIINYRRLDHFPVKLSVKYIHKSDVVEGDIICSSLYESSKRESDFSKATFILNHSFIKNQNTVLDKSGFFLLESLSISDSVAFELKTELGIDLNMWFNVIPLWYKDIEQQIYGKR